MRTAINALVIIIVSAMLYGCQTPNNLTIAKDGTITSSTDTRSIAAMDGKGKITAAYNGVAPGVTMMDKDGVWDTNPGPSATLTVDLTNKRILSKSPKDTIFRNVKITPDPEPGKPAFEAESIETNISEPAKVYANMFAAGVQATQGMSKAEAETRLGAMQAAGEITADIASVIVKALYPAPTATE